MSSPEFPFDDPYYVALERIQKCQQLGHRALDLSKLLLTHLPPEIGNLEILTALDLSGNRLVRLPGEVRKLAALEYLNLSFNDLVSLPVQVGELHALEELRLYSNKLKTLPVSLANLRNLHTLNVGFNHLGHFPRVIGSMASLEHLEAANNHFSKLPPEIGQLSSLKFLSLSANKIEILPPEISGLRSLRSLILNVNRLTGLPAEIGELHDLSLLHVTSNRLTHLPPQIGNLKKLTYLFLDSNDLIDLPPELEDIEGLEYLVLHDNPQLGLPPSILGPDSGEFQNKVSPPPAPPAEILDYYFGSTGDDGERLREVKLIFVGQGEVGKSTMVDALQGKPFVDKDRTDGIAITPWEVELPDGQVKLSLWDFGGQEIMHGTHKFFMTHRSLYIVMVDGRHGRSKQDAEYWLKLARAFGGESPVLVVMNRQDNCSFDLDREQLAGKYNIPVDHFFRTECSRPGTVDDLRNSIMAEVARILSTEERFPAAWQAIKERLAAMREDGRDYFSDDDYRHLCRLNGVSDKAEQDQLLRRLAELGVVVSFPEHVSLAELSVLNPAWATDGIYRVVTDEALREERHGLLAMPQLRALLPEERWPKLLHLEYVIGLMKKFDLCFTVDGEDGSLLVPDLLPDQTPPLGDWRPEDCVVFQYRYSVLLHGILPRFITRTHGMSHGKERWRSGVVLEDDGAEARVQADYDANTMTIWVRGKYADSRRGLLKVIRSNFEQIHRGIKGLDSREMVSIPNRADVLVPFCDVVMDEREGKETFRVTIDEQRTDFSIDQILTGVQSKDERRTKHNNDQSLIQNFQIMGDYNAGNKSMSDNHSTNIGGDVNNSQIGQTLTNCNNMIQHQAPEERRKLLGDFQTEVEALISRLPEENQKKASKNFELAVKTMLEKEPDRDWYEVSAKGLLEASQYAKDFTGNIAGAITNLGKSVWSGFTMG